MIRESRAEQLADAKKEMSPIEHLAKALHFGRWREASFLVATTVYADLSGGDSEQDPNIPVCLVAGWWNSTRFWADFDSKWRVFLARWRITHLHQVSDKKNPDNDWWKKDPDTRLKVLDEAYDLILTSGARSFCFLTPKADYNAYMAEIVAQDFARPDCFTWNAFRFVANVEDWCKKQNISLPEFVFESIGKEQEASLERVMAGYELPRPIFRAKLEDDPSRAITALQAADFLAYEIFRAWKDGMNGVENIRRHFALFDLPASTKAGWGWADKSKMDSLMPVNAAQKRLERIVAERIAEHGS